MTLLLLGLVSFIAWFFSMLSGGGSPLVLIPLVSLWFGAQAVAPVITVGMLVGNSQRSLFFWRHIDWNVTLWHVPGTLVGAIAGAYVFKWIDLEWLQAIVGILLIVMAANAIAGKTTLALTIRAWYFLPLSLVNAFVSSLVGSTGPILNPLYLNYGLEKEDLIATKSVTVTLMHTLKLISYTFLGILSWEYIGYGLVIGLAAIPANWLGRHVLRHMSREQFRHAILTFVAFSGVMMLWQNRVDLLALMS
jgi:uncharacterized protein